MKLFCFDILIVERNNQKNDPGQHYSIYLPIFFLWDSVWLRVGIVQSQNIRTKQGRMFQYINPIKYYKLIKIW